MIEKASRRCSPQTGNSILFAVFLSLAISLAQAAENPPKPLYAETAPACPCESLSQVSIPNTTIESAVIDPSDGSCRVTAIVTHPPSGDRVKVFIALPTKVWNGRFRGVGGGGFVGGYIGHMARAAGLGYAAGTTAGGHEGGSGSFALDAKGRLDWQAIMNFA